MTTTDTIPAAPVYTITIASSGAAMVDGVDVTAPGTDHQAARLAVLAEVRIKAAMYGRPVRATVKDVDGTSLPLVVDIDGTTTTLAHPHPVPATNVRAAAPAGPADPRTLTVAAWRAVSDPENAELLTETAERLAAAGADRAETLRAIRNAHTVWHRIRDDDPETARELAPRLLDLLQDSHPRRTADIIAWVSS
ncbi:hypothetical protein [Streptomyces sp. OspMP-M43]|uniref:hypothetical protein n=1 Tax=Streptomyces sp. OspMP-M43 TaxID=1839781 RepID=UPI00081B6795|nr:hypothetical protein [Streptomyces sp. OspMP-M43]SCE63301.1 hypothetical protein GA0115261_120382 [Streptomyces sp. OspMP-M43]